MSNVRVFLVGMAANPQEREVVWEGKACLIRKPEERRGSWSSGVVESLEMEEHTSLVCTDHQVYSM